MSVGCSKSVSRNTIFFWLRVIINVYTAVSEGDCTQRLTRCVHWSLCALQKELCIPAGFKSGKVASRSTFTSFYFKDVTHKSMDTFSIGPVVAAQEVMWLQARSCHYYHIPDCKPQLGEPDAINLRAPAVKTNQ